MISMGGSGAVLQLLRNTTTGTEVLIGSGRRSAAAANTARGGASNPSTQPRRPVGVSSYYQLLELLLYNINYQNDSG